MTHEEMIEKMVRDPAVRAEHAARDEEFTVWDELLKARQQLESHPIGSGLMSSEDRNGDGTSPSA
jgi:hypothetical protein